MEHGDPQRRVEVVAIHIIGYERKNKIILFIYSTISMKKSIIISLLCTLVLLFGCVVRKEKNYQRFSPDDMSVVINT
jgi:hypothetical protein